MFAGREPAEDSQTNLHDPPVLVYVASKSELTVIVIYNQSICDAIIRAQDVMHSPKLAVRVDKKKVRVWRTPI